MRSSKSFPFTVAFSLVNLQNIFQLITSGVNTDASTWLLPSDLFHINSKTFYCLANCSQSKQVFSCNLMHGLRELCYNTLQVYFLLPQSHLPASTKCMYARDTRPTQDKLNWDKKADMIAAGAEWCISTIYHAWDTPFWSGTLDYTHTNLLPNVRQISRKT